MTRTSPCSGTFKRILGDTARATEIFREAIRRSPDNDQYYLSLTLVQLRSNDVRGATQTLQQGLARIPGSGKILWGLGLISVLEGNTPQAAERLERAVELLPEWAGSYSTLGVFYYETGQSKKAREVLNRFKGSNAAGGLDVNRIEEALSRAPAQPLSAREPMPMVARQHYCNLLCLLRSVPCDGTDVGAVAIIGIGLFARFKSRLSTARAVITFAAIAALQCACFVLSNQTCSLRRYGTLALIISRFISTK